MTKVKKLSLKSTQTLTVFDVSKIQRPSVLEHGGGICHCIIIHTLPLLVLITTTTSSFDLTGDCQAGFHDEIYLPCEHGESEKSSDDTGDDFLPEPEEDEKCLVFIRCLQQLFQRCQMCGCRISHIETSNRGYTITVTSTCTDVFSSLGIPASQVGCQWGTYSWLAPSCSLDVNFSKMLEFF